MEATLSRPVWPPKSEAISGFQNWLICWLLLPNLGFCLLWLVGGPGRFLPIFVTGSIGLALHRAPFALRFGAFVAAFAYSLISFVAGMFNLGAQSVIESLAFALEIDPTASPQYLITGAAILTTLFFAWGLLRRPSVLARPIFMILAMALTMGLATVDHLLAKASRGHYERVPEAGAFFSSASTASGIEGIATGERHLVMIMVESMGLPADPEVRRRSYELWARPEVRARYDVQFGATPYYGSTTSGEIRELCGRWGDYAPLLERSDPACLPSALAAKGYQSQAWHSFSGEMFDRTKWYPNIGFTRTRFGNQLRRGGAPVCPGVFPGACDWAVPAQIAETLKQAKQPQFLYWLTVNSHLPILEDQQLGTQACSDFDPQLARQFPMICRLHQIFDRTGQALASEIMAADFPATDILIVGDHIPPFFDRRHRTQFSHDRVPWILLKAKAPERPGFDSI